MTLHIVSIIPGQELCSEVVDQHIVDSTVVWVCAFIWLQFLGEDNLLSLFGSFVVILGSYLFFIKNLKLDGQGGLRIRKDCGRERI